MDYRSPARLGAALAGAFLLSAAAHASLLQAGDVQEQAAASLPGAQFSALNPVSAGPASWTIDVLGPGAGESRDWVATPRAIYGLPLCCEAAFQSIGDTQTIVAAGFSAPSPVPLPATVWLLGSASALMFLPRRRRKASALPFSGRVA